MRQLARAALALCLSQVPLAVACGSDGSDTPAPTPPADVPAADVGDGGPAAPDAGPAAPDAASPEDDAVAAPDAPVDVPVVEVPTEYPEAPETLGGDRPAAFYVPDDYDPTQPVPLVVLLHGYSATGAVQSLYFGLQDYAESHGIFLIVPEGLRDEDGNQFWNGSEYCCDFWQTGVDDSAYVRGLIDEARGYFAIDPTRIFAIGHSNGGFMSYRMACDHADVIAGIMPLAGSGFWDPARCAPSQPVSVLHVHPLADGIILAAGEAPAYPSAEVQIGRWLGHNGCAETFETLEALDLVGDVEGDETLVTRWAECEANSAVEYWAMQEVGHVPIFDLSDGVWPAKPLEWLIAHPKATPAPLPAPLLE